MWNLTRSLALAVGLLPGLAAAQQPQFPQNLPANTVVGRLGIGPGPSQAIPFGTLLSNITSAQSANTVNAGPPSGGATSPAFRLLVGADLPLPAAATLGGVKSLTCAASTWFNSLSTAGAFGCSQPNFTDLLGTIVTAQIGANQVTRANLVQGVARSVVGVTGNATANVADIQLGASQVLGTTAANTSLAGVAYGPGLTAAAGQLPGEPSTGNASSGNVGEYVESVIGVGSVVSLVTSTGKDVTTLTLPAGDWEISGEVSYQTATTTAVTGALAGVSTTINTLDLTLGRTTGNTFASVTPGASNFAFNVGFGPLRFSISGNTTYHLIAQSTFVTAAMNAYGIIRARRAR